MIEAGSGMTAEDAAGGIAGQPGQLDTPAVQPVANGAGGNGSVLPAGTQAATTGPAGGGSPMFGHRSLDILHGVEMTVTVELGRTRMLLRELLDLRSGSIIELDRAAGSPVDVLINGTLLAHGEVVVVDDEFGVRVTDIVAADDALSAG